MVHFIFFPALSTYSGWGLEAYGGVRVGLGGGGSATSYMPVLREAGGLGTGNTPKTHHRHGGN